jgi:hypothetical protein
LEAVLGGAIVVFCALAFSEQLAVKFGLLAGKVVGEVESSGVGLGESTKFDSERDGVGEAMGAGVMGRVMCL